MSVGVMVEMAAKGGGEKKKKKGRKRRRGERVGPMRYLFIASHVPWFEDDRLRLHSLYIQDHPSISGFPATQVSPYSSFVGMSPAKILLLFFVATINGIIAFQAPPVFNQPPIQSPTKPSFYKIALQWANSFCRNHTPVGCRQQVSQEFTIHGLWPDDDSNTILQPCTSGPELDSSHVHGIVGLSENWPSHVEGVSNFAFWRQEWLKHGRCTGFRPREYFQKAVDFKKQIDARIGGSLVQFFKAKGLPPDEHKRHDPQIFLMEIKKKTKFDTEMQCNMNSAGVYQLYEIKFCFTSNGHLRKCRNHNHPAYSRNTQGAKIYHKKKGPNSQKRSPPPPLRPTPSFHIGMCYGNGRILFPARVTASPPPRPRSPPPPPPPKSPPLKQKQWPPPPSPGLPTRLKPPPSSPISTYTAITWSKHLTNLQPPPTLSTPAPNAKLGRGWKLCLKLIFAILNFIVQKYIVWAVKEVRGRSVCIESISWMPFLTSSTVVVISIMTF